MKGIQIGATEAGLNWLGYSMHVDPSAILLITPSLSFAGQYSRRRIDPMIADCPELRARVADPRARDTNNSTFFKRFPGGTLVIAGANSPISLGSDPARRVMLDELDRFKQELGDHGSPVSMALGRATNFPDRKFFFISSPGVRDESQIERLITAPASDQRRLFLRCPACRQRDFLTWTGYRDFLRATDPGHHWIHWAPDMPETAHMMCGHCSAAIEEGHKGELLATGEWRPTTPGDGTRKGFYLPGLYSPLGWLSWAKIAREFLERKNDPPALRVWVNERLGETWEENPSTVEVHTLLARCEPYPCDERHDSTGQLITSILRVPRGVALLVMSVDTQDDRLEYLVQGYGAGEESWLLEYGAIHGDPGGREVWGTLDQLRARRWKHANGRLMPIEALTIDTMGHHTDQVYAYVRSRAHEHVHAIRGGNEPGAPLVGKNSRKNAARVKLWTLGVDAGKDALWSRLRIPTPGPGFIHMPKDREWTSGSGGEAFVAQLLSEVKKRKLIAGRWRRTWVLRKAGTANHAWDLMVYALAALRILGPAWTQSLEQRAAAWAQPPVQTERPPDPPPHPTLPRRPLRPRGLIRRWR